MRNPKPIPSLLPKHYQSRARYIKAKPKSLGTLHQRMKLVLRLASMRGGENVLGRTLWMALLDLETEVQLTESVSPPLGSRGAKIV